jgi:murein DD-endopeptidase MepM/ murein hydrolase activator NlpD
MATIKNYGAALGGMAKEAITGTAKGLVGGLKGAMIREAPGIAGAYAFGKDLNKRANASAKMQSGGSPPSPTPSSSAGSPLGGFAQAVSLVAGQRQSNVINIEQVRQLKQLNSAVLNQSKLIAYQIDDTKRKNQFAEEVANEQALRDDKLLDAIKNIGGGGGGGKGKADGAAGGGLGALGQAAASAAGSVAGGFLKDGIKYIGAAVVSAIGLGFLAFKRQIAALVLSAALRFGSVGAAVGTAASAGLAISASAIAAIVAGIAALLFPTNAGAAKGKHADTRDERDKAIDPEGAKKREAARNATAKTKPRNQIPEKDQKKWDEMYGKTHDPLTGLPKEKTIYTPPAAGKVSSNFGEKRKDATGKDITHQGVDIAMAVGSDVRPIAPGKVTGVTTSGAAGTYVQVTHPDGKVSEYMHLSKALAKVGDEVTLASIIGKSGGAKGDIGAGSSTGPHLHLQLKTGSGEPIDPTSLPGLAGLTKGEKVSPADNTPKVSGPAKTAGALPGTKAVIDNTSVTGFYKDGVKFKDLPPLESLIPNGGGGGGDDGHAGGLSSAGNDTGLYSLASKSRSLSGTGIQVKKEPVQTEDKSVKKAIDNVAKGLGVNPASGTLVPTQTNKQTVTQSKLLKPLFQSNSDIIKKTNQTFLQQFKSTATNAFTQAITKGLFPKGFGVSVGTAGRDDNFRGQQLQRIFGTDKVINDATTKLLGKQYGPMFAPLFNNLAQGYLEVGSRVAGKAIFQGIGGLGAEETQTLTGQVLGNYAAGNKKLALEQLLYGASGGSKSGIALGPETLLAKYGFKNPAEGIAYFASGLADMATAPLANMMGGDTTNGVSFDSRTGKYYNRDGSLATPEQYAAASRQYGASLNQGELFNQGLNNYGGARQAGYNPYSTTQMQGGIVATGNQPGQFRVVAPSVNSITGVSTAATAAQAFGLTPQQQAGLTKEQLEVQQAQLDLARIDGVKRAEEAKAKLISDAETRAQAAELEKGSAEYNRMVAAAEGRGNALVTMEAAKYTVSGLGGGKEGGGSATPGTLKPGDPGYRSGQLFQNPTDGSKLSFGQEVGNFAFDMGKNMLGNKLTQNIKNPYMQMIANFAVQKGLNYGVDALFGSKGADGLLSEGWKWLTGSSAAVDTASTVGDIVSAGSDVVDLFSWFAADGGIATQATPGVFGEKGAEAIIPLSNPSATKALSAAMGTDKQLTALGDQTEILTSIDGSLRIISGQGTSSGTMVYTPGSGLGSGSTGSYGGGLSGVWNPSSTSGGIKPGVNAGKPGAPSTMDIVGSIAGSIAKSYIIKTAIGAALNLAVPGTTAALAAGFEGGVMAGISNAAGMVPGFVSAAGTNIAAAASGFVEATGFVEAGTALMAGEFSAALAAVGPAGWAVLGVIAVASFLGYGGGGGSAPPPKEPKFHAAIYVTGNNDISAIAPVYQTVDYHAPPDVYKTIAYGLLRVAFNAAKSAEQVTKLTPPFDYLYIKIEFNRISLCWGKGAPDANTLATSDANQAGSWGAPGPDTNLNTIAKDIVNLITDEFKKVSGADVKKLETAAKGLLSYNLDDLSSGLISDLKGGQFKLDTAIGKGIFANNVAESNRISALINAASSNAPQGASEENGVPMVWSMKEGKYVEAPFSSTSTTESDGEGGTYQRVNKTYTPGVLLYDAQGRPVFDLPGTSAGLTSSDFGGTDVVGIDRPANLYAANATVAGTGGGGSTVISAPSSTKIDNSSVANFYNPPASAIDGIRNTVPG